MRTFRGNCLVLALILGRVAAAATLTVPDGVSSIQAAIDSAEPGDTISVKAGEYAEPTVLKSGLHLVGDNQATIILGTVDRAALTAKQCEDVTVEGITFRQAAAPADIPPDTPIAPIVLVHESRLTFTNCAFLEGTGCGLEVDGVSNVAVRYCTALGNGYGGVYIHGGPSVSIEHCEVAKNGRSGITVVDPASDVTVDDTECHENGGSGIYAYDRTHLHVDRCRMVKNKHNGIAIVNIGTKAWINNTALEANAGNGIYVEIGSVVELKDNEYKRNGAINDGELQALLRAGDFATLESLAERLRTEKTRYASGEWQLHFFYDGLSKQVHYMDAQQENNHFSRLAAWQVAYPESITCRIVQAESYRKCGWRERGGGYASEVTPQQWRRFHSYLQKTQAVIDKMGGLKTKDPEYFMLLLDQALEYDSGESENNLFWALLDMIFGGGKEGAVRRAFDEGVAFEPEYYPLYYDYVRVLLPRWGGSASAIMALADDADAKTANLPGAGMYGRIAACAYQYEGDDAFLADYSFSWPRIRESFRGILEQWPDSTYRRNGLCRFACLYDDRKEAALQFTQLGDSWDNNVWASWALYAAWRKWALEDAAPPGESAIAKAVKQGALAVERALANGANPNDVNELGQTLLESAIIQDNVDIAKTLIVGGADVNLTPPGEKPNLQHALENDTDEAMRLLLDHGTDPNVKSPDGWTILTLAITHDKPGKAILLLDNGADPNLRSGIGTPPLIIAISKHQTAVVSKLLERGADVNARSEIGTTPLMRAVHDSDLPTVKLLLERGADPNLATYDGWTTLMEAANRQNLELAQTLVKSGARVDDANANGWTAFHQAAGVENVDVLRYYLELKPEGLSRISKDGLSVLQQAAKEGRLKAVKLLVEQGADVNYRNPSDTLTALSYANLGHHDDIIAFLQQHGATY